MKLYQILWLLTVLILTINIPDYFTCSNNCHLIRDYTKYYPKIEEEENSPNPNPNTNPVPPRNPVPPNNDQSDSSDSDGENENSSPIYDRDEAMLVWSMIFRNQTMLTNLANSIWDKNSPVLTVDQGNKVRLEFNKELIKIAAARLPEAQPEDPERFPIEMKRYSTQASKEYFLREVRELTEYAELLEILGERLWPAVKKIFNEKYAHKEKTMGSDKVYYEFFGDVAQELGVDFNDYFSEVEEATEGVYWKDDKWSFSFDDCVLVATDNFYRISPEWLIEADMMAFYKLD